MKITDELLQESKRIKTLSDFESLGINYIVRVVNGKKLLPIWVFDEKNSSIITAALSVFLNEDLVKDVNFATDQAIGFMLRISKKPKDLEKVVTDFTDAIIAYGQNCESGWFKSPEIQQIVNDVYNAKAFPNKELHNLEKALQDARAKKSKSKNVKTAESNALYNTLYSDSTWKLCVPKSFEGDIELASHIEPFEDGGKVYNKTRWCTASSTSYYKRYTYDNKKPLYVFQYYENGKYKEAWQLAFMDSGIEFMDKNDDRNYKFVLENAPEELLAKVKDVDTEIDLAKISAKSHKGEQDIGEAYRRVRSAELAKTIQNEVLDPKDPETLKITSDTILKKIRRLASGQHENSFESIMQELPVTKVIIATDLEQSLCIKDNNNIKTVIVENGVTKLPKYSFFHCSNLETVQIADSVEVIGAFSFNKCPKLSEIHIPANLKVLESSVLALSRSESVLDLSNCTFKELGEGVFKQYTNLKKIILPAGLTKIGKKAFQDCEKLKEVVLPESLRTIDTRAFANCTSLEAINVPVGLKTLSTEAFYYSGLRTIDLSACSKLKLNNGVFAGCRELLSVKLPQLTTLPEATFDLCEMLQDIELPETLESIDNKAFASCKHLQTIKFPKSLKFVGNYAFMNCRSLKKVIMSNNKPTIAPRAFLGADIKIL